MDTKATARKALLEQEVDRYVRILKKEENPDKVILFGSLATGNVNEWSDIDLVVVNRTELPFLKRLQKISRMLQPTVGTDILYYTPEEFADLCANRLFVQEEIIEKGKVIYER